MATKVNKLEIIFIVKIIIPFLGVFKKPKYGEVYNIGGGRYSNCSILEALSLVEKISKIKIKKEVLKNNRVGDHIWYISSLKKFKKHYPKWRQIYSTKKIINELVKKFTN